MQIEAIRAHPGSAHVMVYGTRRNPSCCMRGITTAPRACSSPATATATGGLERGAPEMGQLPQHHPRASQNSQKTLSKGRVFSMDTPTLPPASLTSPWDVRGGGMEGESITPKPFSPPSHRVSPQQGSASLWHLGPSGCTLLSSSRKRQSKTS